MNTDQVIILARKHIGSGSMESSARLCLADAVALYGEVQWEGSKCAALKREILGEVIL